MAQYVAVIVQRKPQRSGTIVEDQAPTALVFVLTFFAPRSDTTLPHELPDFQVG